jgi:DNA-binding transcriptional regulator GbsR (MarR family)
MNNSEVTLGELKHQVSDRVSLLFENDGFSPLVGKIFVLLLYAPRALSLQEMADQLGVTKAAISVQVRALEMHALCNKLAKTSDRKDYYYISDDFSMIAVKSAMSKMQSFLSYLDETLNAYTMIKELNVEEADSHDVSKRRLKEMRALYNMFMDRLEGLTDDWKERREKLQQG